METSARTYNGYPITVRNDDGFANASQIAGDYDKKIDEFINSKRWKYYVKQTYKENPEIKTVFYRENGETWIHPKMNHFVMFWANEKYALQVGEIMGALLWPK
jgi:hypothetical protein